MRILIGCPTHESKEYCLQEYSEATKKLLDKNTDVLIVDNSKENNYYHKIKQTGLNVIKGPHLKDVRKRIAESRNMLREKALQYDYLLSLEQDVILTKEELQQMLKHDKPVLTTAVINKKIVNKKLQEVPMIWLELPKPYNHPKLMRYILKEEMNEIQKIRCASLACTLIKKEVLEQTKFGVGENGYDDVHFFQQLKDKNIAAYADPTIKPKHLYKYNQHLEYKNI